MNKYLQHFLTICKHKYYVGQELIKVGLYWQAITHDLSKFSPTEFVSSAKYFCGTKSPIENEKDDLGYSLAWLHHKGVNKHHWQYWTDFKGHSVQMSDIPTDYLIEMAADIVGASKAYLKGKYNPKEPLEYFLKHSVDWFMTNDDKRVVEFYIRWMTDNNFYDVSTIDESNSFKR